MRNSTTSRSEATGQNIITVGDGNQINAKFGELGQALADFEKPSRSRGAGGGQDEQPVADIETIQSQLAKPEPNRNIISAAWDSLKAADVIDGCVSLVGRVALLVAPFIT